MVKAALYSLPILLIFVVGMVLPHQPERVFSSVKTRPSGIFHPDLQALLKRDRTATAVHGSDVLLLACSDESSSAGPDQEDATQETTSPFHRYDPIIEAASSEYDVDFFLVKAIIQAESSFNPSAVSPVGASGLMQIMPGTADMLGVRNAFDPEENIHAGVRYFRLLLEMLDGDVELALAAYNAGPTRVLRHGGIPPYRDTLKYVSAVIEYAQQFRSL